MPNLYKIEYIPYTVTEFYPDTVIDSPNGNLNLGSMMKFKERNHLSL